MNALEFLRERKRMCKSFNKCSDGKCAHMDRDCGDCRREFWMQEVK